MKTLKLLLALTLYTSIGFSQIKTTATNVIEEKPYIEVTGVHETEVTPDEIYIRITIKERYENKEKLTIEIQEEKLKTALKEIGIDIKNLTLADAMADYVRVKINMKDVISQKDYSLKVSNATELGKVFKELDKLNIKDAEIQKVSHSKIDSLKKESRIIAIKAAKNKADYLLAAIGEQLGEPQIINEVENRYYDNNNYLYNSRSLAGVQSHYNVRLFLDGDSKDNDNEIQFQKIKIKSSVYVKFAIK